MDPWRITFLALFVLLCGALAALVWLVRRGGRTGERRGLREWGIGLVMQAVAWPMFAVPATVLGAVLLITLLYAACSEWTKQRFFARLGASRQP